MNEDALEKLMGFKTGDYTGGTVDRERQAKINGVHKTKSENNLPKIQSFMLTFAGRDVQIRDVNLLASDWCVCAIKSGDMTIEWIYYVATSTLDSAGFKLKSREEITLKKDHLANLKAGI